MGTWNTRINGNDTFVDIYQSFFDLYNQGHDPVDISKQILTDFAEMFADHDDRNNCLFGLALAQWETKSLDPVIFKQVKQVIESGSDIELWKELEADEKTIKQRKKALDKFLLQLSSDRETAKRRVKQKDQFSYNELVNTVAPDNQKTFIVSEHFTNGIYIHTVAMMNWRQGGGSVLHFIAQGKSIVAKWTDSQTLEITHDKDIVFYKKEEKFFFFGDQGKIIYIPK